VSRRQLEIGASRARDLTRAQADREPQQQVEPHVEVGRIEDPLELLERVAQAVGWGSRSDFVTPFQCAVICFFQSRGHDAASRAMRFVSRSQPTTVIRRDT
jgi:hypothetical protein